MKCNAFQKFTSDHKYFSLVIEFEEEEKWFILNVDMTWIMHIKY